MPWAALVTLGFFHGINPAMGWLFAVAIGLQEKSWKSMLKCLPLIAIGHEGSVAVIAVGIELTGTMVSQSVVTIGAGLVLCAFGVYLLCKKRHFRWVGMRLRPRELVAWSFLMSSAHGAGLMLAPFLLHRHAPGASQPLVEWLHVGGLAHSLVAGVTAASVHSASMMFAMTAVSVAVYQSIGLEILRKAWINLDCIWAGALVLAGVATLFSAA